MLLGNEEVLSLTGGCAHIAKHESLHMLRLDELLNLAQYAVSYQKTKPPSFLRTLCKFLISSSGVGGEVARTEAIATS